MIDEDPLSESFLIYDQAQIQTKMANWKKNLSWIQPFYAIKSNPIQPLLNDLSNFENVGFDCASKTEIKMALELGTKSKDIVYSNSIKIERDLQYANKKGIQLTTADTLAEIVKIQKNAKNLKVLWRIAIPEQNKEQLATIFSNKFGDDVPSIEHA